MHAMIRSQDRGHAIQLQMKIPNERVLALLLFLICVGEGLRQCSIVRLLLFDVSAFTYGPPSTTSPATSLSSLATPRIR